MKILKGINRVTRQFYNHFHMSDKLQSPPPQKRKKKKKAKVHKNKQPTFKNKLSQKINK